MLGALLAILILWIAPSLSAFKIIWDKSSASMINEYGVRASSCLNPLKGLKLPKGGPFRRTKYETEDIQSNNNANKLFMEAHRFEGNFKGVPFHPVKNF